MIHETFGKWLPDRPHTLVVACSDGRLQEATDEFLHNRLGLAAFDRLYVPGGGGALAATERDLFRAQQQRAECRYLVELHEVQRIILLFHGPAPDGPAEAVCADYRRKLPWATPDIMRQRQAKDAVELLQLRHEWAAHAEVEIYRCEVDDRREITFRSLDPALEANESSHGGAP